MDNGASGFFAVKKARVRFSDGDVELTQRPMKVKELPEYLSISARKERGETEDRLFPDIIALINKTVVCEIPDIVLALYENSISGALETVVDNFFELNFGEVLSGLSGLNRSKGKRGRDVMGDIVTVFDFLISQGHTFSEIQEYTLPQFAAFQAAACARLSINMPKLKTPKQITPEQFFEKVGIPVE